MNKKFKVCLEYHLGNCKGPCEEHQEEEYYKKDIDEIKNILNGKNIQLINSLKNEMNVLSKNLEFEEAARLRDEVRRLETVELAISDDPMARQSAINAAEDQATSGRSSAGKGGTRAYRGKSRVKI